MVKFDVDFCFFDAFGTLIYPEPEAAQVYRDAGLRYGDHRSLDEIRQVFSSNLHDVFGRQRLGRSSPRLERESWRTIVQNIYGHLPQWPCLFEELWEYFADANHWRLYSDVRKAFVELDRGEVRVGIASNFDDRLLGICQRLPPLSELSEIFISADLGWRKPETRFFDAIRSRLNLPTNRLCMVGDQLEFDVRPARESGWRAVLLDRQQREPELRVADDVIAIQSLAQLPGLLL